MGRTSARTCQSLRLICGLTLLIVASRQALPQHSTDGEASLRVSVVDPSGASIVAARVVLSSKQGPPQSLETDAHGEASFRSLSVGQCQVHVEAEGFEPRDLNRVTLRAGPNRLEIRLEVAHLREEVVVKQDKQEQQTDRRGDAFTTVLTQDQIAQLPDDPEEFEAALREMAGPGAVFRVNGFRGGKLPPKSQIREIRFRLDPFAAENHEASFISINITTKPGASAWHGNLNFGFRGDALDARNVFAPVRGPEQFRRFSLDLSGPLWRDHTSLFLAGDGSNSYESKTIVAALPQGNLADLIRRPVRKLNLSGRLEHALTHTHTLRAEYQRNANRQDNLGAGDFDLPDRAFSTKSAENLLRMSDSGAFGRKFVNEFRFQMRWERTDIDSLSNAVTILVLNAFNGGGQQLNDHRRIRDLELADDVDFGYGKHALRAGFLLEGGAYQSSEVRNPNGTFTFGSLDAFRAGHPTTFTQRLGAPAVEFAQYQLGWYCQDDFRVLKSLSMSYGLRYELQTNVRDHNLFAPRFGLAWSPFKDGKTTIRGSAGIFYVWFDATTNEQALRVNGLQEKDLVVINPSFPNPFAAGTQVSLPPSRIERDPRMTLPYIVQFSFGLQRQLPHKLDLLAYYSYQRGVHLFRGRNINAPVLGSERPDPNAGNVTQIESSASSTFHRLGVNLNWSVAKRLLLGANYTLARAIDETDGPLSLPANNFDLHSERGPALSDQRHRFFFISYLSLFKGLRLGSTFRLGSALPYNITTGFDDNGDSVINDRPKGVGRNSARGAPQWDMNLRIGWGFGFGGLRESPSQGRVTVVRSGDNNPLGTMASQSTVPKRFHTEVYGQAFNLFNHANLINFTGVQTSPFFGQATAALPGRRMEVGIRFAF